MENAGLALSEKTARLKSIALWMLGAILIVTPFYLFRGYFGQGIQFDEVYRINNIIPLLNPAAEAYNQSVYNLNFLGLSIPLAYKAYGSYLGLLLYLPIGLFSDYYTGFRFLIGFYFLLSVVAPLAVFIFFIKRYARSEDHFYYILYALLILLAVVTSPLLYPDVRIGFTVINHLTYLSLGIYGLYQFLMGRKPRLWLFLGCFILALGVNLETYFIWNVTALFLTSLFFFPQLYKKILSSFYNILLFALAWFIGLFNLIIYNAASGFPTVMTVYNKLFRIDVYNQSPIGYKTASPLTQEIPSKLKNFVNFYQGSVTFYTVSILVILAIYLAALFLFLKKEERTRHNGLLFFPFLNFLIIFFFILISPNTTGSWHYAYLFGFFEITALLAIVLLFKLIQRKKWIPIGIIGFFAILISVNFLATDQKVKAINSTGGIGYFSPAIFDLHDFIKTNKINSDDVLFLQWGLSAQMYFLEKGEFKIHDLTFGPYGQMGTSENERLSHLAAYFKTLRASGKNDLYLVLYDSLALDITETAKRFFRDYQGDLKWIKTFYEKDGRTPVFSMYRLENPNDFFQKISNLSAVEVAQIASGSKASAETYQYGSKILFDSSNSAVPYQAYGFSSASDFTWTDGREASLVFKLPPKPSSLLIRAVFIPFTAPGIPEQIIDIHANEQYVGQWKAGAQGEYQILIPKNLISSERLQLTFEFPKASRPSELGISGDVRQLGIGFQSLVIEKQ